MYDKYRKILEVKKEENKAMIENANIEIAKYPKNIIDTIIGKEEVINKPIQVRIPFQTRIEIERTAKRSGKKINEIMSFFTKLAVEYYEYSVLLRQKNINGKIYYPLIHSNYLKNEPKKEKKNEPDKIFFYVNQELKREFKFVVAMKEFFFDSSITQKTFLINWIELAIQAGGMKFEKIDDMRYCLQCDNIYFKNEKKCKECKSVNIEGKCLIFTNQDSLE